MALTKTELSILDMVLDGIEKSLMEINDNTCPECGTLECVVDYSWSYEMSLSDTKENRVLAKAMEKYMISKHYPGYDQLFEVGKESPVQKKRIFFNSYHMFMFLRHRIKQEMK